MAVYGNNAVCVFVNNGTLGIHTEGTHLIAVFFGTVNNLAFIKLVSNMRKNLGRQFHTHTDINTVTVCRYIKLTADLFHPLTADTSNGNYALSARVCPLFTDYLIAAVGNINSFNGGVKVEIDLIFKVIIKIFKHDIVYIRAQVTHGSLQKMKVVLYALLFERRACRSVELCSLSAIGKVNFVNIVHQLKSVLFADILVKRTAEIVGDIIFTVRKSTCTAEAAHNRAAFAAYTGFYFFAVNRATALIESVTCFKNGNLHMRRKLCKLVGRKNTAGACTDDNNIIFHIIHSVQNYSIGSKSDAGCLHHGQTKSSGKSAPS